MHNLYQYICLSVDKFPRWREATSDY
jgi:hypothetical protein